uniref:Fibronectin type-III domain-containing protein n=1 Tax=Amphimedon queenslandica TaxID=400682 RepID=A0A1X7UGX7_AMPQE
MLSIILLLLLPFIDCANITVQPVSVNATLNSTVVFYCKAVADQLSFIVNGKAADDEAVINRGFSATSTNNGGTRKVELQAIAYNYNNNTKLTCRAVTYIPLQAVSSNISVLMIQGLLYGVSNLDYTFINGSSVLLTWTAPYTLDNVPITGYYIVNGSLNITSTTNNNTNITLSATNPDPCKLNNISVSPINNAGIGSSNYVSFYFKTVPLITPNVSVVVILVDGQQILLNISINVSTICKGEFPDNITIIILNNENTIVKIAIIIPQFNDQLMTVTGSASVTNLNTFNVNVSLSNNGGDFTNMSSFSFCFLGPVTNIDSSIGNCSTIDITWTAPMVDDRVPIQYYILRTYDAITGSLVDTVSVYDTSYQFVNNNLLIHRYTYVITGVNELGEGISNNETFSYQRAPRTAENTSLAVISYTQDAAIIQLHIPIILKCTGEAPKHITVTVVCHGTNSSKTFQIKHTNKITELISVPKNQQCNMTIAFSNEAGSSDPFILPFDTYPNITTRSTTTQLLPTITQLTPVLTNLHIGIG